MSEDTRKRLGIVCEHTDAIRTRLGGVHSGPALLDAVFECARRGQDLTEPLNTLHKSLSALGDTRGLLGFSSDDRYTGSRDLHVAGAGALRPSDDSYECPQGRCSRVWEPNPSEEPPTCSFDDRPLHLKQRR
ncbi:hypothetical protein HNR10_000696 [Nocardiopsis aegyptia]|uniref:Uncharacterized protein n=1 Tax=Nocardiopsis aegyptia TaxID=220378 RepID=A0A7Z0EKB1_9ACTN|nr:hypothetical protein [Nocardiopsis aegyptia]